MVCSIISCVFQEGNQQYHPSRVFFGLFFGGITNPEPSKLLDDFDEGMNPKTPDTSRLSRIHGLNSQSFSLVIGLDPGHPGLLRQTDPRGNFFGMLEKFSPVAEAIQNPAGQPQVLPLVI